VKLHEGTGERKCKKQELKKGEEVEEVVEQLAS
jgi:hypothetical protein